VAPSAETVDMTTVAASSALDALAQGLAASSVAPGKPVDAPANEHSGAAAVTLPVRTLEDTVADLLRPMLRQWLDSNMPRIVEKALRVELAENVKPVVKTGRL
jgi:cell pole-organizing protein PopZ